MNETIDFFKYKGLLAELESIKGKKKPVHDFIKKLYKLFDEFYLSPSCNQETEQTARYIFMLVTKAITYDGSINTVNSKIIWNLKNLANQLTNCSILTAENVLETYEHYPDCIDFRSFSIEDLLKHDKLIDKLGTKRTYMSYYSIKETKSISKEKEIIKLVLLRNNPKSLLGNSILSNRTHVEEALKEVQDIVNVLQPILKETK